MFSKKVDLTVTTYCQIDGEDFVNFCGLLRKRELYPNRPIVWDIFERSSHHMSIVHVDAMQYRFTILKGPPLKSLTLHFELL